MPARTPLREAGIPRKSLKKVLDFINANATGNISLHALAEIAGVTPHYFSSLFTRTTGISPHQYVLRERIGRGKLYLRDRTLSVGEVSRRTGFRTQEHFTKVFRKIVGVTPTAFRRERFEEEHGE
jgi:AraC-like DNA-binding protein